jgi:glycerophosphoryl diester phosphodiesterase
MLERLKADIFIHNYKFTNEKLVRKLHNFGYKIFVYTVNKPDDIKRMIEIGVDGVITDEVKLVKKILSKF